MGNDLIVGIPWGLEGTVPVEYPVWHFKSPGTDTNA